MAAGLFDIISGNTEINHPLCEECTDTLLDVMDQHLRMIEDDCHHYKLYLEKLVLSLYFLRVLRYKIKKSVSLQIEQD